MMRNFLVCHYFWRNAKITRCKMVMWVTLLRNWLKAVSTRKLKRDQMIVFKKTSPQTPVVKKFYRGKCAHIVENAVDLREKQSEKNSMALLSLTMLHAKHISTWEVPIIWHTMAESQQYITELSKTYRHFHSGIIYLTEMYSNIKLGIQVKY